MDDKETDAAGIHNAQSKKDNKTFCSSSINWLERKAGGKILKENSAKL